MNKKLVKKTTLNTKNATSNRIFKKTIQDRQALIKGAVTAYIISYESFYYSEKGKGIIVKGFTKRLEAGIKQRDIIWKKLRDEKRKTSIKKIFDVYKELGNFDKKITCLMSLYDYYDNMKNGKDLSVLEIMQIDHVLMKLIESFGWQSSQYVFRGFDKESFLEKKIKGNEDKAREKRGLILKTHDKLKHINGKGPYSVAGIIENSLGDKCPLSKDRIAILLQEQYPNLYPKKYKMDLIKKITS